VQSPIQASYQHKFGQWPFGAGRADQLRSIQSWHDWIYQALTLEGASRNITANAIAPGHTETEMVHTIKAEVIAQIVNTPTTKIADGNCGRGI
jgi:hypothetical protein